MPRLTSKGQVTIPKRIRDYLGLKPGAEVGFVLGNDGCVVVKAEPRIDSATQIARQEHMRKALQEIRGTLDLGMTTDEFMRFLRGDPDE
jgi:antitoxin PrlF